MILSPATRVLKEKLLALNVAELFPSYCLVGLLMIAAVNIRTTWLMALGPGIRENVIIERPVE